MDGVATDGEHLYRYAAVAVDVYLTLSVKKEQWKWMVLPLMESICMLLWLLMLNTVTFCSPGTPKCLQKKTIIFNLHVRDLALDRTILI